MTTLREHKFQVSYSKDQDNIAEEFYLPCLSVSDHYDRISGYFGSTIYILAWSALKDFVKKGGKMRIMCSPFLTEEDQKAIEEGLESKREAVLRQSLINEFNQLYDNPNLTAPSRALACLIAMDVISIKIAVGRSDISPDIKKLFHDKVGLFYQGEDIVGFRGSINETFKGLSDDGNIESIDVFPNWEGGRDEQRVYKDRDHFNQLWNNEIECVQVYDLPEEIRTQVKSRVNSADWETFIDQVKVTLNKAKFWAAEKKNGGRTPKTHQWRALEAWVKQGHRGILEHATGSGKTYTSICAIRKALEENMSVIVLVPSTDLLKQWEGELQDALSDLEINYLPCGDGNDEWKNDGILDLWTRNSPGFMRITLATMDTASSPDFISRVSSGAHLMVVADEAHRMGSPRRRNFFAVNAGYRLGLSATPRRYGDPEGTAALIQYFGPIVQPPYTLKNAIDDEVLTPYFYKPCEISLSAEEQKSWDELTDQIKKRVAILGGDLDNRGIEDTRLKSLLLARARILKKASAKVSLAKEIIKNNYISGQRWILYCEDTTQLKEVLDSVNSLPDVQAFEYYSDMAGDRTQTLRFFNSVGGIMVSIKCLDEGVDIPATTHALILASSQNPREFIQRRGRILRRYTGKHYAHLFDAIVVPNTIDYEDSKDSRLNIVEAELCRAIQFGEWSADHTCITKLKNIAIKFGLDYNKVSEGGYEDE